MSLLTEYFLKIEKLLHNIEVKQKNVLEEIAARLSYIISQGGVIHTFGTGHSHLLSEELFHRAGGLALVNALLEPELMLHQQDDKSMLIERLKGYGEILLDINPLRAGDALVIISNSGRNPVPVELALGAQKRGLTVIALTNLAHSSKVAARDESGKRLFEVADYVLDNCGCVGDACLPVKNKPYKICPTSTISGCIMLQGLIAATVEKLLEQDCEPPVFMSSNIDGSDKYNKELIKRLYEENPSLGKVFKYRV